MAVEAPVHGESATIDHPKVPEISAPAAELSALNGIPLSAARTPMINAPVIADTAISTLPDNNQVVEAELPKALPVPGRRILNQLGSFAQRLRPPRVGIEKVDTEDSTLQISISGIDGAGSLDEIDFETIMVPAKLVESVTKVSRVIKEAEAVARKASERNPLDEIAAEIHQGLEVVGGTIKEHPVVSVAIGAEMADGVTTWDILTHVPHGHEQSVYTSFLIHQLGPVSGIAASVAVDLVAILIASEASKWAYRHLIPAKVKNAVGWVYTHTIPERLRQRIPSAETVVANLPFIGLAVGEAFTVISNIAVILGHVSGFVPAIPNFIIPNL